MIMMEAQLQAQTACAPISYYPIDTVNNNTHVLMVAVLAGNFEKSRRRIRQTGMYPIEHNRCAHGMPGNKTAISSLPELHLQHHHYGPWVTSTTLLSAFSTRI